MRRALLLSLLAHGLVLLGWRLQPSGPVAPEMAAPLRIELRRQLAAVDTDFPPKIGVDRPASSRRLPSAASSPSPAASTLPPVRAAAGNEAPAWLESSRAQIAAESRHRMLDPMFARPPPTPATAEASPLARATRQTRAGETLLRDGLVRIVSANGAVYCLQRPPDILTGDGQLGILALPMNCP